MSQQPIATPKAAVKVPPYAWVILVLVYMVSMAAPLNQFKVPPLMPLLIRAFNMSLGSAGMFMSIFSIMGILLALPAAFLLRRFGSKIAGLIAAGAGVVGSVLGALSTTPALMLISRLIEGVGMGLIMVIAPAAISMWFPAKMRGTCMGVWSTTVAVGSFAMYNLAPALAASYGWQSAWWAGAAFAFVAFVLYLVLFRTPRPDEAPEDVLPDQENASGGNLIGKAMTNGNLWLLSLSFLCFNVIVLSFSTYYPTFLNSVRHLSLAQSSFMVSITMIVVIFSSPLGGFLSDRLGSRKLMIIIPYFIGALVYLFPFSVTGWMIPALMIAMGFLGGPIAPACFAAVPEVLKSPQLAGIGMGVVVLGQNLGMFIGPALLGWTIETFSWSAAGYLLPLFCVFGIIAAWPLKIK